MTKTTIDIKGEIELNYDENSAEFKEALESYRECCDGDASKDDMLRHVAFHVTRFDTDVMVEGVGYVAVIGQNPVGDPYSGITIGKNYDEFEFEII